jgi:hypothetical protein
MKIRGGAMNDGRVTFNRTARILRSHARHIQRLGRRAVDAGGSSEDIEKLTNSVRFIDIGLSDSLTDQLGYMDGIASFNDTDIELNSELLGDVLRLARAASR